MENQQREPQQDPQQDPHMPVFRSPLLRQEALLGWLFVPVFTLLVPLLLGAVVSFWPMKVSDAQQSTVYYLIGFLYVLIFLRRFVMTDWLVFWDRKLLTVLTLVVAHLLNVILSFAIAVLTVALWQDGAETFAADTLPGLSGTLPEGMFTPLVLLAPLAEEVLFRGVVFGTLRKKSRAAAYIASMALFAVYSVWQIAAANPDVSFLFLAVTTVPIGAAACFCYERTHCIWAPTLYRALLNLAPALLASF